MSKAKSESGSKSKYATPAGLPERWMRSRLLTAVSVFLLTVLLTFLLRDLSAADRLDGWWLRARFTAREKLQPSQPSPDIVLVELDEKCTKAWPEPILFWGPHFADALENLRKSGARMVALDYIQSIPVSGIISAKGAGPDAARAHFDQYDARFGEALSKTSRIVMAKEESHNKLQREWIRPTSQLLYSIPNAYGNEETFLGYADTASDNIVTAIPPALYEGTKIVESSFAARIVDRAFHPDEATTTAVLENDHWTVPRFVSVPLREDDTVMLNYTNGTGRQEGGAFKRYSMYDVANGKPNPAFKEKIVLIGATFRGSNDDHFVPFMSGWTGTRRISGVEMQANFLQTLLTGKPINEPAAILRWLIAVLLGALVLLAFYGLGWTKAAVLGATFAVLWVIVSFGAFTVASLALPINLPLLSILVCGGLMGGYRALGEERERSAVLSLWGRYQDPRLVAYLLRHPDARGGQGQEMEVTVLFADLKSFTKTVEHLSPTEAIENLNRYLSLMTDIVLKYDGYVDKYLGDGLLAQWGAPEPWSTANPPRNHASAAVRACLELQERSEALTREIQGNPQGTREEGSRKVTFGLRLSLHTGPVVVGWVGAEKIEFTIIGDTVNVCSRLQETAKEMSSDLLISENTYEFVASEVAIGRENEVAIRGRDQPLKVYEILSGGPKPGEFGA